MSVEHELAAAVTHQSADSQSHEAFIASSKELLAQLSVAMAQINVAFKALNNTQNALAKLAREGLPAQTIRERMGSAWRVMNMTLRLKKQQHPPQDKDEAPAESCEHLATGAWREEIPFTAKQVAGEEQQEQDAKIREYMNRRGSISADREMAGR